MDKKTKTYYIQVQGFSSSDADAAAGAAATTAATAAATAAASAAALVFTTVFTVVATMAAAEAAAVAAAVAAVVAAAPAAASVSEEQNSWTLNIISFLVFVNLLLHMGVASPRAINLATARSTARLGECGRPKDLFQTKTNTKTKTKKRNYMFMQIQLLHVCRRLFNDIIHEVAETVFNPNCMTPALIHPCAKVN